MSVGPYGRQFYHSVKYRVSINQDVYQPFPKLPYPTLLHAPTQPRPIRKIGSVQYNNLFYCYSFCKNILKYLSRMARVSLRTAERSTFLTVLKVSDASGLCKCSIRVQFYEAPFYYKIPILWYHKKDFLISQIRFYDIKNRFFDITK